MRSLEILSLSVHGVLAWDGGRGSTSFLGSFFGLSYFSMTLLVLKIQCM